MNKVLKSLPFRLLLGLALGIVLGRLFGEGAMKVVVSLQYIMGQLITFCVPLIVIGFIAPSITRMGKNASRMLGIAVLLAYVSSILAAFMSMGAGYALVPHLHIATDDGSNGNKGFVTQALQKQLEAGRAYDTVIAIGPLPMMKAVCDMTREPKIRTIVSMNPIMIDGTGMCGGCRISVGGKTKFVCVDGPEFDGHQVDWDLMIHRMGAFKPIEAKAREHVCNLYKGI